MTHKLLAIILIIVLVSSLISICIIQDCYTNKEAAISEPNLHIYNELARIVCEIPNLEQLYNPIDCVVLIETHMFLGSGVVISGDGLVLTAGHILAFGLPDKITFKDGVERTEFELLYIDTDADIGLFKIKYAFDLPYLLLGDSNELEIGDKIWAIGMPFGEEWWHCYGRISKEPEKGKLYVSAALNPGNSGCPILNQDNEIIGICTSGILPGNNMTFGHTSNICAAIIAKYRILYE